ncbi:Ig-like domain-containing protein, partial [uncultured Microbulbifer sp.]|uniref:beta strand repeat-containing protein n=1 Tax=uncultured Microbulbifer sp. TaxID=348147 RepID=UPI0026041D48
WTSSDTAIAAVDSQGALIAVDEGNAIISASQDAIVSNTVTVTVSSAVLTDIQVTPAVVSLPKGNAQQLTALGTYSDGTRVDLTDSVDWHIGDTAIATLDMLGELVAVGEGSTTAFASSAGMVSNTVTITITVTGAELTSIQVTPASVNLAKGNTQQLTALGRYTDGSSADITDSVDWHSDNTAVATLDRSGELTAVEEGSTTASASWGDIVSNTVTVTVSGAVLTAIQVTPASNSLAKGNSQQLTAQGTFSDGTTADLTSSVAWTSSDTNIVTVDSSGELTAVNEGNATVSASQDGIVSNTATVTITGAVLTALQVTPATIRLARGNSQQLAAMGTYSDGSTADLTNSVAWTSSNTATITINTLGQAVAVGLGNAEISASQNGIASNTATVTVTPAVLTGIQVTPATVNLAKGNAQQLTALGRYSDGSTADITNSVSWNSNDTAIATLDMSGELTAVEEGGTTAYARLGSTVSNPVTVSVTGAVLTAIQITPANNSLAKGNSQQLAAMGTYSDGSTADLTSSVAWNSSDTNIATVDSSGELTAVNEGNTTVSASQNGILSNTATVAITAAVLTNIQVTPANNNLAKGNTQQLTAQGTFSDGTTADLTSGVAWSSSDTNIATVDSSGELMAVNEGNTTVSASQDGIVSNTATVAITAAVLTNIQVTPASNSLAKGTTQQLTAQGTFSDGTTSDLTNSVAWTSSDTNIVTVDSQGELTAVNEGDATVSASQNGIVSNTATVTITGAVLTAIQVTPASNSLRGDDHPHSVR